MINFNNVTFSYNNKVDTIYKLNLNIKPNQIFGLLGHNGAGKTTIFRLIVGVLKPKSGDIQIDEKITSDFRKNVSYMPEGNSIYEKLTAMENLKFRARVAKLPNHEIDEKSKEVLTTLKLIKRANDKSAHYSNGMKKRLALACALISKPKILLLDEPTNAIDPESVDIIIKLLKKLNAEGTTIIFSTHDLNLINELCTNIAIINEGETAFCGELNKIPNELKEFYISLTTNEDN